PDMNHPLWLRYPAVSPDGTQVAFVYAGQIWIVPIDGGEATALTGAPFYSSHPVWSPDGKRIAFSADRHGNADIFVVSVDGGPVTRLTYNSAADVPTAFSPDGARVYFNSKRLGDPKADAVDSRKGLGLPYLEQLYSVPSTGGRTRLELATVALDVRPNRDGSRVLYTDNKSIENDWRKHQVSDAARDIWIYEPATGKHTQLTEWRGEDRNAVFSRDETAFLWLSERGGSFNVWRRPIAGGTPEQVTFHETWPVRFLSSADDGTLVYAYDGELWRLKPGATDPEQIDIRIRQSNLVDGPATVPVNDQATEIVLSPNGNELALIARGEVFVVSLASGATRRITATPAMERFLTFSPDGRRLAYASMRDGDWDIYEARLTREEDKGFSGTAPFEEVAIVDTDSDTYQPVYSPDGGRIAYLNNRTEIRVLDIASGTSVEVLPGDAAYSYNDGDMQYAWSPDGKWLVARTGIFSSAEIELLDAAGVAPRRNLSLNGYTDDSPSVSQDGAIVLWTSDRNGLRASNANGVQSDVYAAFLTQEAFDIFRASPEERALLEAAKGDGGAEPGKEKEAGLPDLDGVAYRTGRLTPFSSSIVYYELTPDDRQLLLVTVQDDSTLAGFFIDVSTHAARQIFSTGLPSDLALATDAKLTTLYLLADGRITAYNLADGQSRPVPFRAEIVRDVREEVSAIFEQNWRSTKETFYLPDMQGADWDAIGDHYRKFLPHIFHWEDLAELQSEMVGELNASHQGSIYRGSDPTGDLTASLGLYYDQHYQGPGEKIAEVIPGGPADRPDSALTPGAVILAVDGAAIEPDMNIDRFLNRKQGQSVLLSVRPADGGEPVEQKVKPVSVYAENELAYERWVAKRREIVERLSNGRIGYIHVRGMELAPYQDAYGELFGRYRDAEAVVVDIRSNGGGNLHDQLDVLLTGRHDSSLVSRDGVEVIRNPVGRFTGPSVLLASASSYSDASVFPTLYQYKGIGKIVGERVPGTGTSVTNVPQIESRLTYRVPELGFQLTDGRWFENLEVVPDILVYDDPQSVAAGRDLQLERAVEYLLGTLPEK
ncbi:MAG: PD40 domain-containing protein, partial [Bauldia sp.]|nr:PD40 domain-containing protein [Bauldia sp.]